MVKQRPAPTCSLVACAYHSLPSHDGAIKKSVGPKVLSGSEEELTDFGGLMWIVLIGETKRVDSDGYTLFCDTRDKKT